MDTVNAINTLFAELSLVANNAPNERLPQEAQTRCCLYAFLRPKFNVVCVERGYNSIDAGDKHKCDVLAIKANTPDLWLELKHCRCASDWQNKPSEERRKWEDDLDKLRNLPIDSDRYFVLVCFSDFDPCQCDLPRRGNVIRNIRLFHSDRLLHQDSRAFTWRVGDGISHVGAWVWHWSCGIPIGGRT